MKGALARWSVSWQRMIYSISERWRAIWHKSFSSFGWLGRLRLFTGFASLCRNLWFRDQVRVCSSFLLFRLEPFERFGSSLTSQRPFSPRCKLFRGCFVRGITEEGDGGEGYSNSTSNLKVREAICEFARLGSN